MSAETTAKAAEIEKLRTNEGKWTKTLMHAGWTVVPSIIIEKQAALGLDAIDMNILFHLASYWWLPDNVPHPSVKKMAKAVGVHERTVQKHIMRLELDGLIRRQERRFTDKGSNTNLYYFDGLIEKATPFAIEKIAQNEVHAAEKAARIARKKPKLSVVGKEP